MEEVQSPNHDKSASLAEMVPPANTATAAAIPPVVLTAFFPIPNPKPAESVNVAPATVIRPIPIVPAPGVPASPPFDLNLPLTSPSQSLESTR
ncbi:hypothetical protein MLD38_027945 [Melastoma candidum]|nr:hypothetical protein MLD38_027945 [Melastoma candidum]